MPAPRGKFIWYDVMTDDPEAATSFYRDVIGWDAQEYAMPDRSYTVFHRGPVMVAGLMAIPEAMYACGAKPCWSGYVSVDDVDGDVARVKAAGGAIARGPEDIPNVGRFAVASDPGGAVFLLFKPNTQEEEPMQVAPMTPGHIGWHELHAGNLAREFAFYSGLFGWTKDRAVDLGPAGSYQTFATGGAPCGGMMTRCDASPGPCWNYYIAVDSVAMAAGRAIERGGQMLHGPHQVPGGAWIVQASDPQGGAFAMISSAR